MNFENSFCHVFCLAAEPASYINEQRSTMNALNIQQHNIMLEHDWLPFTDGHQSFSYWSAPTGSPLIIPVTTSSSKISVTLSWFLNQKRFIRYVATCITS